MAMHRIKWAAALLICITLVLAGCGKKDTGSVVKDLDKLMGKMQSYSGTGLMTLHTGQDPQQYEVEVWYKHPSYYRIGLTNTKKESTQIVLRNAEGVYVLTPHLNKSFRFQSDWPDNQGQVYLYQSLLQSIVMDNDRQMTTEGDMLVFDVLANYQNPALSRQKIWLDKKTYAPHKVEVNDSNARVVVSVEFSNFIFDQKFEQDAFDMQRNMTGMVEGVVPTNTTPQQGQELEEHTLAQIGIVYPSYSPEGVKLPESTEIQVGTDKGVLLRYSGTYNYTLQQYIPHDQEVSLQFGRVIDLGFTVGYLTGNELQTLRWMHDGVEFRLSSGDLSQQEMIKIASSVQGQAGK